MRYVIWQADDFFEKKNLPTNEDEDPEFVKITMDASIVTLPEEAIPLTMQFNNTVPPIGEVLDIRLEAGAITGEMVWFEETNYNDEVVKDLDLVFGGYYKKVEFSEEDPNVVVKAELIAVSVVPHHGIPHRVTNAVPASPPTL